MCPTKTIHLKTILRALLLVILLCFGKGLFSQIVLSDGGQETLDCSTTTTFLSHDGGPDYGANLEDIITICPGPLGNSVSAVFDGDGIWDVDESDMLFIYDGTDTTAPLLGAYNAMSHPQGFPIQSTLNNATGCLTFRLASDGSAEGAGWSALLTCGIIWQPFQIDILSAPASEPLDTAIANICLGETIQFGVDLNFTHNDFGGNGYVQTQENCACTWSFGDGTSLDPQPCNVPVSHTYEGQYGYIASVEVQDTQGQLRNDEVLTRVSTTPAFSATLGQLVQPSCVGQMGTLVGGVSQTSDTLWFGADPVGGTIFSAGTFGEQLYLPDGSGVNYETTITMENLTEGAVIESAADIQSICMNVEHSYLGDLEMQITCPNGATATLFDSYDGFGGDELSVGGFGGGGTFLGNAQDNSSFTPGEGFEYCFSTSAPFGTFENEFATNTVAVDMGDALQSGTYLPEQDFATLIGCPVNGDWQLTIRDNLGDDDGYIFSWSLALASRFNLVNEEYFTPILSASWVDDPTIVNFSDSLIDFVPPTSGNFDYTFNVQDAYGCGYDTTITILAVEAPQTQLNFIPAFCPNTGTLDAQILNANASVDYVFEWTPAEFLNMATAANTDYEGLTADTEFVLNTHVAGNTACASTNNTTVPFIEIVPIEYILSHEVSECPGTVLELEAIASGGLGVLEVKWLPLALEGENITHAPEATTPITLSISDGCQEVGEVFNLIVNDPGGEIIAESSVFEACVGEAIDLTESISGGNGNYTLSSNFSDLNTDFEDFQDTSLVLTPTALGEVLFTVEDDCRASGSFAVQTNYCEPGQVIFPNALVVSQAGGDSEVVFGGKSIFKPVYEAVQAYQLYIFNRWGELIFESQDIDQGWNGKYNEKYIDSGVFVYRADVLFWNGEEKTYKGDITVLK